MITLGKIKYGEASKLRILKDGFEYDPLFEKAPGKVFTIKKGAGLSDTVKFIPKVVRQTKGQTFKISQRLKGSDFYQTCKNIWEFVYNHIQYRKDKQGYEQIRSPRRTWHDRRQGVDCDCYSVFISSILANLYIPHILRITKYNEDHFQHIYPVVPFNGRYIMVDCVTDHFDYEVPYTEKKDYSMDLQFLDGIPDYEFDGLAELGRVKTKKRGLKTAKRSLLKTANSSNPAASAPAQSPASKKKKKGFLKKIASKVNRINPAAIAIRNGILAAMKLNVFNIAKRLRWSYLTKEQAVAKGVDPNQFDKLVRVREKLESIFETGGGKVSNLKKAMLKGKGNKDKSVHGFDGLGDLPFNDSIGIYSPLGAVLGNDIYYSENIEGFDDDVESGLGELGEPITLASVGAAMGVLTGIVAKLKDLGNIFKGKQPGSQDFDAATNEAAENNQPAPDVTPVPATATNPLLSQQTTSVLRTDGEDANTNTGAQRNGAVNDSTSEPGANNTDDQETADQKDDTNKNLPVKVGNKDVDKNKDGNETFWNTNKTWIKPVAIIGGSIAVVAICAHALSSSGAKNKSSPGGTLSGFDKTKNHVRNKNKKHKKIHAVALI